MSRNLRLIAWILCSGAVGALATCLLLLGTFKQLYLQELSARLHPAGVRSPTYAGDPRAARILFLGDSRAANWLPLPAQQFRSINGGQPGATTAQILLGTEELLARERPAVVVFQGGINDLKSIGVLPGAASQIESECVSNIHAIVDLCRQHHARIVITLIFRPGQVTLARRLVWSELIPNAVQRVNRGLMTDFLGQTEVAVLDVNRLLWDRPALPGVPDYEDTLHLRPSAYRRIEPALIETLEGLLSFVAPSPGLP